VTYEIEESIRRANGLLEVRIDGIKDQEGRRSRRGSVPKALSDSRYRVYEWKASSLRRWVEHAAIDAGKPCLSHQKKNCFMCRWMRWW
jgi:hypothetical protein